ncbi:hypothetical protein K469DRAFT_721546 [Zopfia rhizophila CBS 207.26]|uniref:Uncharacterized protein n=1 Tax=Zopfia rhizophila CBS 207.26 TaxID=1314779 RepID=A0A6A6EG03_9PEZI|nr:hypothetical protein K469DRAFT_721546 [Zopfia rhizophila CBS 207.26]
MKDPEIPVKWLPLQEEELAQVETEHGQEDQEMHDKPEQDIEDNLMCDKEGQEGDGPVYLTIKVLHTFTCRTTIIDLLDSYETSDEAEYIDCASHLPEHPFLALQRFM